jgi:hypothetical protein
MSQSLAYEVAPFNIKMTIVQPHLELSVLTNKLTLAPSMPAYNSAGNPASSIRSIFSSATSLSPSQQSVKVHPNISLDLSSKTEKTKAENKKEKAPTPASQNIEYRPSSLSPAVAKEALAETVHAILSIAGHENPPARHIVGSEGVNVVKDKLKTVSEELEDFLDISGSVDIF